LIIYSTKTNENYLSKILYLTNVVGDSNVNSLTTIFSSGFLFFIRALNHERLKKATIFDKQYSEAKNDIKPFKPSHLLNIRVNTEYNVKFKADRETVHIATNKT
jgi:hypothetical protein